jgi:hypothetical protein
LKKAIPLLIFLVFVVILITSQPSLSMDVPLPQDIKIIPPSPDVPKEIAAFSRTWEGNWDGWLDAKFIVEEINSNQASIIYSWGDAPRWKTKKGYIRIAAKVSVGGKNPQIEFGDGEKKPKFIFTMNNDLKTIEGSREFNGRFDTYNAEINVVQNIVAKT